MKKLFFMFVVVLSHSIVSFSAEAGLDVEDRSDYISSVIHSKFEELEKHERSAWNIYNGSSAYNHLGIDQLKLAKKIIDDAFLEGRTDVYILDSGAGNFQSCDTFAEFINDYRYLLPSDITVHIIGTRGERYSGKEVENVGICKIYKFGSFKIEEHQKELAKRGLNLDGKIDLTISNWANRHYCDPLVAWLQLYHTTRPKTGLMVMDWAYYLYEGEDFNTKIDAFFLSRNHLIDLLMYVKAPFLLEGHGDFATKEVDRFVLKRINENPLNLPLAHSRLLDCDGKFFDIGSHRIMEFKILDKDFTQHRFEMRENKEGELSGDISLYKWFINNQLIVESYSPYFQQLLQIQPGKDGFVPLYTSDEIEKAKKGYTQKWEARNAKHKEIEQKKKSFFSSLKSWLPREIKPVNECIANEARHREHALYAALRQGDFIKAQDLIGQGANSNKDFYYTIPQKLIDMAIDGDLPEGAITFLVKNKADLGKASLYSALYYYRSFEDVKLLIDHGIKIEDVNLKLSLAISHGKRNLVDLFISHGGNINEYCNGLPMIYSASYDKDMWNYLIDLGAKGTFGEELKKR